ncbi:MAG: transglutaminase-like domain-containing protein [Thermodesulfobacteriota bacterium]|nr:transglutaminase-like domain-containing protein [Thermodesulfobacteriota bacterium]
MKNLSENEMAIYLKQTFTIEAGNEKIVEMVKNLTADCLTDEEKAVKLFYFVRDSIRYNLYMISVFIEDFRASKVLEWGKGYCVQKAVLLTALGRAAGIPSRMAFAMIRNHSVPEHIIQRIGDNLFPRHGYNQFFLNGRWVSTAATFDRALCEKNGLPTVEFDGKEDAMLPPADLAGKPFIEYVEKFPPREDLPFEWIAEKIAQLVGPEKRPWLEKEEGHTPEPPMS